MMTRFALCTAVHAEAGRRILNCDDELAAAVGIAFARYYAILKNARRRPQHGDQQPKPKHRPFGSPTISGTVDDLPLHQIGRITFKVNPEVKKAWVKLGDSWVDGDGWKGLKEIAKVPPQVLEYIRQMPNEVLENERKLFQFYAELRDKLQL